MRAVFWLVITVLVLISVVWLSFPKQMYHVLDNRSVRACECLGSTFYYGSECIGMVTECTVHHDHMMERECLTPSCAQTFAVVKSDLESRGLIVSDDAFESRASSDIMVVIDSSNSMEGQKLSAAKSAAIKLVDSIGAGERIGLITFDQTPHLVHNLSDDKRSLIESINLITLSGGTMYLPALEMTYQIFSSTNKKSTKGIIFLSDGVPSDNITDILDMSRFLWRHNMSLFTISFGIKTENNMLEQMVAVQNPVRTDRLYRSYEETDDISEAFYEGYKQLTNLDILRMSPLHSASAIPADDLDSLAFAIYLNETRLTGTSSRDSLCIPSVDAMILATDSVTTRNISLVAIGDQFIIPDDALPVGTYDLVGVMGLDLNAEDSCVFSGQSDLGSLRVTNSSCEVMGCNRTHYVLSQHDFPLRYGAAFPRSVAKQDIVFLLDTSESMQGSWNDALRALADVNAALSSSDRKALITFDETSHLLVPYTFSRDRITESMIGVNLKGTTRLAPALKKAYQLSPDMVIIISDGQPYDHQEVTEWIDSYAHAGVCTSVLTVGTSILTNHTNRNLFERLVGSCGVLIHDPDARDILSLASSLYQVPLSDEVISVYGDIQDVVFPASASVSVKVIGGRTALSLPVSDGAVCVRRPLVHGTVDGAAVQFTLVGSDYVSSLPLLAPGRHTLVVNASLPTLDCTIESSKEFEFLVAGSSGDHELAVIGVLILLVVVLIVCAHSLWTSAVKGRRE